MVRFLWFISLVILASVTLGAAAHEWKAMRQIGPVFMIYVEPAYADNKAVIGQIIANMSSLIGDEKPFQLDFFDTKQHIPITLKYTAKNTLHHRARYNFNPANQMRRFGWLVPKDPDNLMAGRRFVEEELDLPAPEEPESALDSNPEDE